MRLRKFRCDPLRLEPTDRESVSPSGRLNFAGLGRYVRFGFCKSHAGRGPIAAQACSFAT
jgi:hypothetical protein